MAIIAGWAITAFGHRPIVAERETLFQYLLAATAFVFLSWALLRPDFIRIGLFSTSFFGGNKPGAQQAGRRFYWHDLLGVLGLVLIVVEAIATPCA